MVKRQTYLQIFNLTEINLFEDMFKSQSLVMRLSRDTRDIIVQIPLIGQERLSLKIATPSLTLKRRYNRFPENHFIVHKVN